MKNTLKIVTILVALSSAAVAAADWPWLYGPRRDQQPPFVRGGSILADGLLLMTDGNTKLYLVEPSPAGFKPLASAVILEPGDNWAPLALVDGKLLVRGQKELKALQVAR
jgi:hypothetical protein